MSSQITKLVLVPLEEWKRLNKNGVGGVGGGGDTYTTIEIPSSKPSVTITGNTLSVMVH